MSKNYLGGFYPYDITRNGVRTVSHSNGNDGNQNRDLRDLRKYREIKPRNRRDREERVVQKRWNGSDGIATVMGQLRKKRHHEKRTEHSRTIINVAKFRCVRACSKNRTNFFVQWRVSCNSDVDHVDRHQHAMEVP